MNGDPAQVLGAHIEVYDAVHALGRLSLDDLVLWKPRMEIHDVGPQSFGLEGSLDPSAKVPVDIWLHDDLHVWDVCTVSTRQIKLRLMPRPVVGAGTSPAVRVLVVSGISIGRPRAATVSVRVVVSSVAAVGVGPVAPVGSAIVVVATRRVVARWPVILAVLFSSTASLPSSSPLRTTVSFFFGLILEPGDFQIYQKVRIYGMLMGNGEREREISGGQAWRGIGPSLTNSPAFHFHTLKVF